MRTLGVITTTLMLAACFPWLWSEGELNFGKSDNTRGLALPAEFACMADRNSVYLDESVVFNYVGTESVDLGFNPDCELSLRHIGRGVYIDSEYGLFEEWFEADLRETFTEFDSGSWYWLSWKMLEPPYARRATGYWLIEIDNLEATFYEMGRYYAFFSVAHGLRVSDTEPYLIDPDEEDIRLIEDNKDLLMDKMWAMLALPVPRANATASDVPSHPQP